MSLFHHPLQPLQPPLPEGHPFIAAIVKLSIIMHNSTTEIYDTKDKSLSKLWASAHKVRNQVLELRKSLTDLFPNPDDEVDPGPLGVRQSMFLNSQ